MTTQTFDDVLRYLHAESTTTMPQGEFIIQGLLMVQQCERDASECSQALLVRTFREVKTAPGEIFVVELEAVPRSKLYRLILQDGESALRWSKVISDTD